MHYRTLISADDLMDSGLPPDWVLIDCRFDLADTAWVESVYRESHIPGASHARLNRDLCGGHQPPLHRRPCWRDLFSLPGVLKRQWDALLMARAPGSVIHMCGSGVTACHNMLAMVIAGLSGSRLYVGSSWSEWIRDRGNPVAVGGR